MEYLDTLIGYILTSYAQLSKVDIVLLSVNGVLLLFSRWIIQQFSHVRSWETGYATKLHIFRAINILVMLFVLFNNFFLPAAAHSWVTRSLAVVVVVYLAYLLFHILVYFIKKRFGRQREVNGTPVVSDTYNSRALSLVTGVFVFVVALISVIRILGFESLLEAGGVIGFVGVMLALTQGSWAPDIISGLIILNSNLVEEGDVIEIADGQPLIGVIFKTKIFHTEILNLVNNHRVMLRNAKLRDYTIHNLSKFASARGLREMMCFKIDYEVPEARVRGVFNEAFAQAASSPEIAIEDQFPLEIRVHNTGDFAVEWAIYYYTKDVKNLIRTRQLFRQLILEQSAKDGVSLATPQQHLLQQLT